MATFCIACTGQYYQDPDRRWLATDEEGNPLLFESVEEAKAAMRGPSYLSYGQSALIWEVRRIGPSGILAFRRDPGNYGWFGARALPTGQ